MQHLINAQIKSDLSDCRSDRIIQYLCGKWLVQKCDAARSGGLAADELIVEAGHEDDRGL